MAEPSSDTTPPAPIPAAAFAAPAAPMRISDTALQILRERVIAHPFDAEGKRALYVDGAALLSLIDEAVASRRRADVEALRKTVEAMNGQVNRISNVAQGLVQRVAVLERQLADRPSLTDPPRVPRDHLPRGRRS